MRRLIVLLALALSTSMLVTAVQAKPQITVNGTVEWDFSTINILTTRTADGKTIMTGTTATVTLTGTFSGTAEDVWRETVYKTGVLMFDDILTFTGTVDSKSGTLVFHFTGKAIQSDSETPWLIHWVILSGTGELANLHGQGTLEGGYWVDTVEVIPCYGQIRFAPN